MIIPLCSGCFWDHFHRKSACDDSIDYTTAAANFYRPSDQAPPIATGVELEMPMNSPPLTSLDPEAREKWVMSLREAIEIALSNSKIVRKITGDRFIAGARPDEMSAFDPAIAEARIQQELGKFDTSLIFNLFWGKDENPLNSNIAPSGGSVNVAPGNPFIFKQDTFGSTAARTSGLSGTGDVLSLRKLLATGGEINFGFNTDYTLSNVPANTRAFRAAYDTRFFTSFRQPIGQGYGVDVNRAPILIARLQSDKSLWDFKLALMDLLRDVELQYWNLVVAEAQYQAVNKSIELSIDAVRRLELSVNAGTAATADLLQARQQLEFLRRQRTAALAGGARFTSARENLIGPSVLQAERQLRSLIGLPPSDGRRIVPADEPQVAPIELDWYNTVIDAFTHNPDIQGNKLIVAARREALKIAVDGLKPKIDLFIRHEWDGLGTEFDDSIKQINHDGLGSTVAGVQVQYTFGYQQAAGVVQQRRNELDKERELLRVKAQEVEHTLAEQYTQVIARYESWTITVRALEFAKERVGVMRALYEAEKERSVEGYLDAVQKYSDAVKEEIAQRIAYQMAIIDLEFTKGTIFKYDNVHVHEDMWPAPAYRQAARQAEDRERAIEWYHGKRAAEPQHDHLPVYGPDGGPSSLPSMGGYGATPQRQATPPSGTGDIPLELTERRSPREPARSIDLILPTVFEPIPDGAIQNTEPAVSDPGSSP